MSQLQPGCDNRPDRLWRILLNGLAVGLLFAGFWVLSRAPRSSAAPLGRADELIAEVNALRASYGLAAYRIDPILMAVAKAQNDYRVAAGVTTHSGPDGSRPRERAAAAGYGGGANIFISENIADGSGLTPAEAVQWWTGDDPHLNTMIGPNYVDVGAGAGEAGGTWRYTLMAGYVAGGSYSPPEGAGAAAPGPGYRAILATATPRSDGAIVHTVGPGQTLWTIAAIYEVDLNELMALNGFTDTPLLHAGDEVTVRPAPTQTATASPEPTATEPVPASPTPTRTPRPTTAGPPTATAPANDAPSPADNPFGLGLVAAGALLVVAGALAALRARSG